MRASREEPAFQEVPIAVKIAVFSGKKTVFASERRALTWFAISAYKFYWSITTWTSDRIESALVAQRVAEFGSIRC